MLVTEKKGYSFRLQLLSEESPTIYRALAKRYPSLVVGDLLIVKELKVTGDLIERMIVVRTISGSSDKQRVLVDANKTSVGDFIDNVPILRIGSTFNVGQERKAYAYFS